MAEVVERAGVGGQRRVRGDREDGVNSGLFALGHESSKCTHGRQQEERRELEDARVCYLVSLALVVLEAKKTRRGKKKMG